MKSHTKFLPDNDGFANVAITLAAHQFANPDPQPLLDMGLNPHQDYHYRVSVSYLRRSSDGWIHISDEEYFDSSRDAQAAIVKHVQHCHDCDYELCGSDWKEHEMHWEDIKFYRVGLSASWGDFQHTPPTRSANGNGKTSIASYPNGWEFAETSTPEL